MKKSLSFAMALLFGVIAWGGSRDTVSFTLMFADRPVPDLRSYEALWLTGEGFKRDNEIQWGRTYEWFAVPVLKSGLPWELTYDGYADIFSHGSVTASGHPNMSVEAVLDRTIELWRADEAFWRKTAEEHNEKPRPPTWATHHLLSVIGGYASDGAPYPWNLPCLTEEGCPAVVRDGLFYDLTARFGTPEAKKRILVVSSEYDWGTRFCLGYRVPTLGFEKEQTAFRQVYTDGVGGETIAELQVRYPGKFLGGGFHWDRAESYFKRDVLTFVLEELQKPGNRGKTIRGTYFRRPATRVVRVLKADGSTVASEKRSRMAEWIEIEGREKTNDGDEALVVFDGELPPGLKAIEAFAFAKSEMFGYKKGTIRLPEGLESIGAGAFRSCYHLTGVEIPDSVTNIGAWAFCECGGLKSVRLPKNLKEIPDGLFCRTGSEWRKDLEQVTIPPGVRRIGKYAFSGCVGLKEVSIPDSVEVIDDYAFYGCRALARPKLAPSVRLGKFVFSVESDETK